VENAPGDYDARHQQNASRERLCIPSNPSLISGRDAALAEPSVDDEVAVSFDVALSVARRKATAHIWWANPEA